MVAPHEAQELSLTSAIATPCLLLAKVLRRFEAYCFRLAPVLPRVLQQAVRVLSLMRIDLRSIFCVHFQDAPGLIPVLFLRFAGCFLRFRL